MSSFEVRWVPTTFKVYGALYRQHADDLEVYGTYTDMGSYGEFCREALTTWAFKGSDVPLMRSIRIQDSIESDPVFEYYLPKIEIIDED